MSGGDAGSAVLETRDDEIKSNKAGGNNQKLMLLRRGKAISQAPIKIGINQIPENKNFTFFFINYS